MQTTTANFRLVHAGGASWDTLLDKCLAELGRPPEGANLGFVYMTDSLDDDVRSIVERLKERTGIADWVGTIGFGICCTGKEYFDEPAIAILIGALPAGSFQLLPQLTKPGEALPDAVNQWVASKHPMLGIVHADPRNPNLPALIDSISDDTDCFLVGGITASRGKTNQIAGRIGEGGASGVLFAGDVPVVTGLTQGCSPIGPVHEITKGREHIVMELDGRPALDVFKEDIGEVLARNLGRAGNYIHAALPIAGKDTADYLVRNLIGIDPDKKWIAVGDRLSDGDKLMFVRRDAASARKDLKRMLSDLKQRAGAAPKAALYYSCVARGPNLFGPDSEELRTVQEAIGDVPLAGFFANGEISHNRLYGYTGVLTLLF